MPKKIAIDFDGVIHRYSKGYQDGKIYDIPLQGAFRSIKKLIDDGNQVFILSSRRPRQIRRWLKEQFSKMSDSERAELAFKYQVVPFYIKIWKKKGVLGIAHRKLPAQFYIDDRAVKFDGDWEKTLLHFND
ncbi:hypothetical protein HGB24_02315 [Candidatus Saccharibacteria bacterium]|nr:hypothetical protein [Candidatus Saccharibacteria bacterium]